MPHAFPTRRSSDLRAVRDAFVAGNGDPALQGRGGREAARLDGEVCHRAALLTAARQSGKAHADLTVRPAWRRPSSKISILFPKGYEAYMVKAEWGTKRSCPKCATRFYDLTNDDPVTCKIGRAHV